MCLFENDIIYRSENEVINLNRLEQLTETTE